MPSASDARLLVLHGLRLKGNSEADGLVELTGLAPDEVAATLAALAGDGLVQHREGLLSGWTPTPRGRAEQEQMLARELDGVGGRPAVQDAYARFGPLNGLLLEAVTDWQLRDGAVNRHTDAQWDAAVLQRLAAIDHDAQVPLATLEGVLDRFGWHRPRLASALTQARQGKGDWVARPGLDSYHTVWFQLHEDLLTTLGRQRSDEGPG
jgi:hypothetical protein